MPNRQNVSSSRVGPTVQPERAAGQQTAGAVSDLAFEIAGEVGARPGAVQRSPRRSNRRRVSRRRYRYL